MIYSVQRGGKRAHQREKKVYIQQQAPTTRCVCHWRYPSLLIDDATFCVVLRGGELQTASQQTCTAAQPTTPDFQQIQKNYLKCCIAYKGASHASSKLDFAATARGLLEALSDFLEASFRIF